VRQNRTFENQPASVPAARRFATGALTGASRELTEAVALMVSELATNCVVHTNSDFEITISQTPSEIRVEALDRARGEPRMQSPGPSDPHGRGLRIVDALSSDWGVDLRDRHRKVVWFTVPTGVHRRQSANT
jgi:anti-sigma regulatory factor (Ser/Thr protein kinase)